MYRSGADFGHGMGRSRGSASAFAAYTVTGYRYKRASEPESLLGKERTKKLDTRFTIMVFQLHSGLEIAS